MTPSFELYFRKIHPTAPMLHKARFYKSLNYAPHMRPPVCLRYAMWTLAAGASGMIVVFTGSRGPTDNLRCLQRHATALLPTGTEIHGARRDARIWRSNTLARCLSNVGALLNIRVQEHALPSGLAKYWACCAPIPDAWASAARWNRARSQDLLRSTGRLDGEGGAKTHVLDGFLGRSMRLNRYWMADVD